MANEPQLYEEQDYGNDIESADIEDNTTKVGISQKSKAFSFVILAIVIIGSAYFIFNREEKKPTGNEVKNTTPLEKAKTKEGETITNRTPSQPDESFEPLISNIEPEYEESVDVVPEIAIPKLPPVAEVKVDIHHDSPNMIPTVGTDKPTVLKQRTTPTKSRLDQLNTTIPSEIQGNDSVQAPTTANKKTYNSIMLMNGGKSNFSGTTGLLLQNSSAATVTAAKLPYPTRTIAEGKLIDAVLETAINTDFGGKVRAIISRDVYGDFVKTVFIPKGSRVIGSYSGSVTASQTRVLITWERLIRPDAVDIMINSPATDQFGRSGVAGDVDNKYLEIFNNAILLSLLTIGTAMSLDEVSDSDGLTVDEDDDGSTTTSGTASDFAAADIIDTLATTGQTVLTNLLNVTPTITIPHGTRIKIFVSQDLLFPDTGNETNDGMVVVE